VRLQAVLAGGPHVQLRRGRRRDPRHRGPHRLETLVECLLRLHLRRRRRPCYILQAIGAGKPSCISQCGEYRHEGPLEPFNLELIRVN